MTFLMINNKQQAFMFVGEENAGVSKDGGSKQWHMPLQWCRLWMPSAYNWKDKTLFYKIIISEAHFLC